jgi:hypothetical protein
MVLYNRTRLTFALKKIKQIKHKIALQTKHQNPFKVVYLFGNMNDPLILYDDKQYTRQQSFEKCKQSCTNDSI